MSEQKRFALYPNPAPASFLESAMKQNYPGKPIKAAVVSNHPPGEIVRASGLLREQGLLVDLIGVGGSYRRMAPAVLSQYDVIITVGKTSQYGLVTGVPIYCYDNYGGPGYLSNQNYKEAAYWHFSGRGFGLKSAEQIYREIIQNFDQANEFSQSVLSKARREFDIENNIERILNSAFRKKFVKLEQSSVELFVALQMIIIRKVNSRYDLRCIGAEYNKLQKSHQRLQESHHKLLESHQHINEDNQLLSRELRQNADESAAFKKRKSVRAALLAAKIVYAIKRFVRAVYKKATERFTAKRLNDRNFPVEEEEV